MSQVDRVVLRESAAYFQLARPTPPTPEPHSHKRHSVSSSELANQRHFRRALEASLEYLFQPHTHETYYHSPTLVSYSPTTPLLTANEMALAHSGTSSGVPTLLAECDRHPDSSDHH